VTTDDSSKPLTNQELSDAVGLIEDFETTAVHLIAHNSYLLTQLGGALSRAALNQSVAAILLAGAIWCLERHVGASAHSCASTWIVWFCGSVFAAFWLGSVLLLFTSLAPIKTSDPYDFRVEMRRRLHDDQAGHKGDAHEERVVFVENWSSINAELATVAGHRLNSAAKSSNALIGATTALGVWAALTVLVK
jgi:hypothetical protein